MSQDVAHQRNIADRKAKAAFYTRPEAAALMIDCAANHVDADTPRVADFACGTGALLEAASRRFAGARLYGADIEPKSVREARKRLPDAEIRLMPYGPEGLGSLELLEERDDSLFGDVFAPDRSFDVVAMNPPYTRNTNHTGRSTESPLFTVFNLGASERAKMRRRMKSLPRIAGNGHAGVGSYFVDLAHAKVRPGGVIGLILPFSFCRGESWEAARDLLTAHYIRVEIISLAMLKRSFSHDTGMGEVMIIAKKR